MENLTAKEVLLKHRKKDTTLPHWITNKHAIEAMKEYAKAEVKKENTRLHDRFVEAMSVGYSYSAKEFLK